MKLREMEVGIFDIIAKIQSVFPVLISAVVDVREDCVVSFF